MQTIVETSLFIRHAAKLFSEDEKNAVVDYLASNPYAGDEIPDTGGVRKLRVPAHGKGKRGGARVIYYVLDDDAPLYALMVYGKGEKTNLTGQEKAAVRALAKGIKSAHRSKE